MSRVDRFLGYCEPYATRHASPDVDTAVQEEVANAARAVARGVAGIRAGRVQPDAGLSASRAK